MSTATKASLGADLRTQKLENSHVSHPTRKLDYELEMLILACARRSASMPDCPTLSQCRNWDYECVPARPDQWSSVMNDHRCARRNRRSGHSTRIILSNTPYIQPPMSPHICLIVVDLGGMCCDSILSSCRTRRTFSLPRLLLFALIVMDVGVMSSRKKLLDIQSKIKLTVELSLRRFAHPIGAISN